jgi:hypothetical protein
MSYKISDKYINKNLEIWKIFRIFEYYQTLKNKNYGKDRIATSIRGYQKTL